MMRFNDDLLWAYLFIPPHQDCRGYKYLIRSEIQKWKHVEILGLFGIH